MQPPRRVSRLAGGEVLVAVGLRLHEQPRVKHWRISARSAVAAAQHAERQLALVYHRRHVVLRRAHGAEEGPTWVLRALSAGCGRILRGGSLGSHRGTSGRKRWSAARDEQPRSAAHARCALEERRRVAWKAVRPDVRAPYVVAQRASERVTQLVIAALPPAAFARSRPHARAARGDGAGLRSSGVPKPAPRATPRLRPLLWRPA